MNPKYTFAIPAALAVSASLVPGLVLAAVDAVEVSAPLDSAVPELDADVVSSEVAVIDDDSEGDTIIVNGKAIKREDPRTPATVKSVTAEALEQSVNLVNTEDALKYLPSLLVRKRFIGDTGATVATRTTGINASARTLIFADGIPLTTLIGNNNGSASPQWFLVPPGEIERVDVLYGPYSAAYAGNSYGAVIDITTHTPDQFEGHAKFNASSQQFRQYATDDRYAAYDFSAGLGDRHGAFTWRLGVNHLDSDSQPVTYLTLTRPGAANAVPADPNVSGAFADRNRTNAPIDVIGAGNFTNTQQDSVVAKLGYDFTPALQINYTAAYWQNDANTRPQTYLRDANGQPYFGASGSGKVNLGDYSYGASTIGRLFTQGQTEQQHLAQALSLKQAGEGEWDWQFVATSFEYLKDVTRTSTDIFSNGQAVGAGRIADAGETGWGTLDAKAIWHPQGLAHQISFGVHGDRYQLGAPQFDTSEWRKGSKGAPVSDSQGKTETTALWAQDLWRFADEWTATLGARLEKWKAYDGFNTGRSGSAPNFTYFPVNQPKVDKSGVSPKATLAWQTTPQWQLKASVGRALRFPTVGELYQNIQTGTTFTQANPFLKPENVLSSELAALYADEQSNVRFTVFNESVKDTLISQTSLIDGFATPVSFVQNVDKTRQRGFEIAAQERDGLIAGLELSGNVTYVDAEIRKNDGFVPPASTPDATTIGKRTPSIAKWRATLVSTYHPTEQLALTLAGRYSTRLYSAIDNSDVNPKTYQGFEGFFVLDARAHCQIDTHWSAAVGVDNLNNQDYFLFHPFPQRTVFAELAYKF